MLPCSLAKTHQDPGAKQPLRYCGCSALYTMSNIPCTVRIAVIAATTMRVSDEWRENGAHGLLREHDTDTAQVSSTAQCAHAAAMASDDCTVPNDCQGLYLRPAYPKDVHLEFVCEVGLSGLPISVHVGQDDAVGAAGGPAVVKAHRTSRHNKQASVETVQCNLWQAGLPPKAPHL